MKTFTKSGHTISVDTSGVMPLKPFHFSHVERLQRIMRGATKRSAYKGKIAANDNGKYTPRSPPPALIGLVPAK